MTAPCALSVRSSASAVNSGNPTTTPAPTTSRPGSPARAISRVTAEGVLVAEPGRDVTLWHSALP